MSYRDLARPFEVGHHCAWLTTTRTPVPMKRVRHVEVGRALHPPEPEYSVQKFVSAVDARADGGDVVHFLEPHLGGDLRYRLWPRLCLDPLLVPVALQHLRGRGPVLRSDTFRRLVPAPSGATGGNLDDGAVRIPMVNRFEVMAIERAVH